MTSPMNSPMLVVGAGPTGLMMAAALARHGGACRIIDKNQGPSTQSRALAIRSRTLEVFDDLGIVQTVLDQGQISHGATLDSRGAPRLRFSFDHLESPYPYRLDIAQSHTAPNNTTW